MSSAKARYLERYKSKKKTTPSGDFVKSKKKKKKKKKGAGLKVIDEDYNWKTDRSDPQLAISRAKAEGATIVSMEEAVAKQQEDDADLVFRHAALKRDDGSGWVGVDNENAEEGDAPTRRLDSDDEDDDGPRRRHDSDADDESPQPKRRHDSGDDMSPTRVRHDSDGDSDDLSPKRSRVRLDSDDDMSPLRSRAREDSDGDMSPVRRGSKKHDSDGDMDLSPQRKKKRGGKVDDDVEPRRKRVNTGRDNSLPRRRNIEGNEDSEEEDSKVYMGLLTSKQFTEQNLLKEKKKMDDLKKMSGAASGEGAKTVFRDKRGRKLESLQKFMDQQAGKHVDDDESKMEWGSGLKQDEDREREREELKGMQNAPFARGRDDDVMNAHLRNRDRWGDPMLAALKRKKQKKKKRAMNNNESNVDVQMVSTRPYYQGEPWHNRYGILPGYRWDGVDRSNKWERKRELHVNNMQARKDQGYKWSASAM